MHHYGIKELLDNLYLSYKSKFSSKDPVWNLHRFSDERDIEIAGLLSSAYAYGSVDQINRFIDSVLKKTGNKPYEFTINFQKRKDKKHLKGLYYRFNTGDDLANLFYSMNKTLIKHSSLKNAFLAYYHSAHENIISALAGFTGELSLNGQHPTGRYYRHLIPNPNKGSTCKRMNLFLRWMVRKDEIDLGLWSEVDSGKLIMPVDTHIARISKKLKLVKRKSVDLKFALELTNKLKQFDSADPVKYDFALCHSGIDRKILRNDNIR
jgi:uncharacterized protein (TIGR02757 family)